MTSAEPRYRTIVKLASGGMATVWIGAVSGALGFRQLVAIKKPHPHVLELPNYRDELMAEARLASLIQHGNVVDVRDVTNEGDEVSLVMDYIEGGSLRDLIVAVKRSGQSIAPGIIVRILLDTAAGLHAAHELLDERGRPVGLIHRDVSPQNILVGLDGISRVTDFGVAKYTRKFNQETETGTYKGKFAYMAPEYLRQEDTDRRLDVFALGVVMWEAICGERCFQGDSEVATIGRVLTEEPRPLSELQPDIGSELDEIARTALAKNPADRFSSAGAFANALESAARVAGHLATHAEVARTMRALFTEQIEQRRTVIREKMANEPSLRSLAGVAAPDVTTPMTPAAPAAITAPMAPISAPARISSPAPISSPALVPAAAAPTPTSRGWLVPALGGAVAASLVAIVVVALVAPKKPVLAEEIEASAPIATSAPAMATTSAPPAVTTSAPVVTASAPPPPPPPPPKPEASVKPRPTVVAPAPSAKPKKNNVLPNPYD